MTGRVLIVPAAGRGSRLKSRHPKPLVRVAGRAMLDHLFDLYGAMVDEFLIVVNPESEAAIREHCSGRAERVRFAVQEEPTGMLDAILLGGPAVDRSAATRVWITWADQISVRPETISALATITDDPGIAMALPTLWRKHPYTHLERDESGRIVRVRYRREHDAMPEVGESELGLFGLSRLAYLRELFTFSEDVDHLAGAATGERNFLPFLPWLSSRARIATFPAMEDIEAVGVNTPEELAQVEAALLSRRQRVE